MRSAGATCYHVRHSVTRAFFDKRRAHMFRSSLRLVSWFRVPVVVRQASSVNQFTPSNTRCCFSSNMSKCASQLSDYAKEQKVSYVHVVLPASSRSDVSHSASRWSTGMLWEYDGIIFFELGLFAILTSIFRLALDVWRVERQCIGPTLDGCILSLQILSQCWQMVKFICKFRVEYK